MYEKIGWNRKNQKKIVTITRQGQYAYFNTSVMAEINADYCDIYVDYDCQMIKFVFNDDGDYKLNKNSGKGGSVCIRSCNLGLEQGDAFLCVVEGAEVVFGYTKAENIGRNTKVPKIS